MFPHGQQSSNRVRYLVAALLAVFAVMIGLAINRYLTIERRLDYAVSENTLWAASQNEIELNQFLLALTERAEDPQRVTRAQLEERFDILWSRVALYREGSLARSIAQRPDLQQILAEMQKDLSDGEAIVYSESGPEQLRKLHERLRHHAKQIREITTVALQADRDERHQVVRRQEEVKQELTLLFVAILLVIGGVVVSLLRSEARARRHMVESFRARQDADAAWRQLDEAIENINEGFVLYDAQDRLVRSNRKYREIYALSATVIRPGATFEELIRFGVERGQYENAKIDPENWIAERMRRRGEMGEPFEQQLGDGRWLMVSDRRTSEGGRVGIRTDITDLKRNLAELEAARNDLQQQAERMKSLVEMADAANRSKSDFLAMISHEIRTPMNAVLGLANLLAESNLETEQQRFVEGIEESGAHLLSLINNILDFSKLEAQKGEVNPTAQSVRAVVQGATRIIAVLADKKRLRLELLIDPEMPDRIVLDGAHLNQVLINLLGNAVKFTEQGRISLHLNRIAETPDDVTMRIVVDDTGIGIPSSVREAIFQPFERGKVDTRGQVTGTGLGLAITQRLVTMMGGKIALVDREGPGTRFEITFTCPKVPDHEVIALPEPEREPEQGQVRPLRILVAEDTPASQLVIRTMLERRGHDVTLANDGQEAIDHAGVADFDLVILDIQMPRKTGFEAAAAIRQIEGLRGRVPIVALSAQAFQADRQRAMESGFDEHLAKPIRPADLNKLLLRVAEGSIGRRTNIAVGEIAEPDHLAELEAICDPPLFHSLLQSAIDNISEEHDRMQEAMVQADFGAARRAAHKLAGVLGQYSSVHDARAATNVELAGDEALPGKATDLARVVARSLDALRNRQGAAAAATMH